MQQEPRHLVQQTKDKLIVNLGTNRLTFGGDRQSLPQNKNIKAVASEDYIAHMEGLDDPQ